jgi:hypothetical protein
MKNRRLAYYITPHGFGHAVRSIEVMRHLLVLAPALEIVIVSTLPEFLVDQSLGDSVSIRRRQLNSFSQSPRDSGCSLRYSLFAFCGRISGFHSSCRDGKLHLGLDISGIRFRRPPLGSFGGLDPGIIP